MRLSALVTHRVRGFRAVDLAALALFLVLALSVYAFKTFAGAERADIVDVERQIDVEDRRVRLLKAEIARLESPQNLERLATAYAHQAPIKATQEVSVEALPQVAAQGVAPPAHPVAEATP